MMTFRRAQPADRAALEACFCALQEFERTIEPNRADARAISSEYIDGIERKCVQFDGAIFVAELAGRVVGFVGVLGSVPSDEIIEADREHAYVTDLFVAEEHRRTGIGAQLMSIAEAHARSCGARRLRVGVLAANTAAHRLYRSLGYQDGEIVLEKCL